MKNHIRFSHRLYSPWLTALFLLVTQLIFAQTMPGFSRKSERCDEPPSISRGGGEILCEELGNISIDITVGTPTTIPPGTPSITFASTVDWGGTFVADKNIRVFGILIMDTPLIFANCNFSMTEDAVIRTSEEADFTAFVCKFFCCDQMWKGIEAKDGGKVMLWSCEIEDARIALQVDEDTPYNYLYSNRFNRNHIAIANGSAQPGSGTLNFAAFLGNRFECTEETNAAYDGLYFPASNWSVAHILLDHCAASFSPGIYSQFSNYFLDADHGIYLVDADVVVQNALFLNLGIDGIATHWEFASNTFAGSRVKATDCTFTDAGFHAIWAVSSDLDVSGCEFNGYYYSSAIESAHNYASETVKINDNAFNYPATDFVEVIVERPVAVGTKKHLEVNGNIFTQQQDDPVEGMIETLAGIYAYGYVNINVRDQAEISDNTFYLHLPDGNGDPKGIVNQAIWVDMLFRYDNTTVNGNTITVDDTLLDAGIVFDNQFGAGNEVSHNTVTAELGQDQSDVWFSFYGLDLFNNTMGLLMCDNSTTGTRDGIRFWGNNGLSTFQSNSFGEHNTGLVIENFTTGNTTINGSIGDQIGHGNIWSTANGAYLDLAGFCQQFPLNSEFIIENAYSPGSAYFPATNLLSPSSGWFKNQNVSSDWCAPGPPPGPGLSDRDLDVAGETGSFSGLNAVSKWEERRLLLDKLLRYPALKAGNQTIVDCYNEWIDSLPGRYAQMSYDIRQALSIDSTDQAAMDQLKTERDTLYAQLIDLETGVEIPEEPEDMFEVDEEWVADKEAVYAEIAENQADEASLKAQIRQGQLDAAGDLLELNDSLPATTQYEINHRLLNRLSLQLFLNDTLTAAEEAQLRDLAEPDQTDGGLAARDARALLPLCESRPASPREQSGRPGKNSIAGASEMNLFVLPNPATHRVALQFATLAAGHIAVTDAAGQTRAQWDKPAGQSRIEFDIAFLPAGVYFISYLPVSGQASTQKVVVLR